MSNKKKYNWNEPSLFPDDNLHPTNMEHRGYKTIINKNGKTQRLAIIGRTKEDFIRKSQAVWGDQYDYSETVYTGSKSPVTIRCKKHNHYFTVPFAQNHYMKPHGNVKPTGCDLCTAEAIGYYPRNRGPHRFRTEEEKQREAEEKARKREERKQRAEQRKNEHSEEARLKRQQEEQAYIEKWQAKNFFEARFKDRVFQMYGDKYDTSLVDYINNETEVTLICPEHGEFRIRPRILLVGVTQSNGTKTPPHGCWKCCGMIPPSEKQKPMTADEFFQKMDEIYGDRFDFSNSEYNGKSKPVTYICKIHGEQKNEAATLLSGKGCDYCSGRLFYGPDFERLAREIHGDKYNYSQVGEIKKKYQVVTIGCPVHGPYQQRVDLHLRGHGCPECYGQSNKWDAKERARRFFEKARSMHGDQFDYSEANYVDKRTPIRIRCKKHDYWFTCKPDEHVHVRSGGCCPYCTAPNSELEVMLWLDAHGMKFEHNKPYPNNDKTLPLLYITVDIYLEWHGEQIIIETNGQQHYKEVSLFKRKNRNLIIQQHRDRYLRQYCKDEGITLLEIPFTEYDRIPSVLHEFFKDRGVYDNNIYTTNSDESVKLENTE